MAEHADLVDGSGHRRLVRHGDVPERAVQTGIGPIVARRSRVRDRRPTAAGGSVRFTSAILPPYLGAPLGAGFGRIQTPLGVQCALRIGQERNPGADGGEEGRSAFLSVPLARRPAAKARSLPRTVPWVRISLVFPAISRTCWRCR